MSAYLWSIWLRMLSLGFVHIQPTAHILCKIRFVILTFHRHTHKRVSGLWLFSVCCFNHLECISKIIFHPFQFFPLLVRRALKHHLYSCLPTLTVQCGCKIKPAQCITLCDTTRRQLLPYRTDSPEILCRSAKGVPSECL